MTSKKSTIKNHDLEWAQAFSPTHYLETYYPRHTVRQDEKNLIIYQNLFLRNKQFDTCLDVGSGPTLHHAFALAPRVNKLFVTDYVHENIQEIERWLTDHAKKHDWSLYIEHILQEEGVSNVAPSHIQDREALLKQKAVLGRIDLSHDIPLSVAPAAFPQSFDLVTSYFCADSATHSRDEYLVFLERTLSLVKDGGWFFITSLGDTNKYYVKKKRFPSPRITYPFLKYSLLQLGATKESLHMHEIPVPDMKHDGFERIYVAFGQISRKK